MDKHRPDVLLLAVGLPDGDGVDAARHVMSTLPCPIVLLTSHTDTMVAAAKAYVHALNKLLVKRLKTMPEALTAARG